MTYKKDFPSFDDRANEYQVLNEGYIKKQYPLIYDIFGDAGVKIIAKHDVEITRGLEQQTRQGFFKIIDTLGLGNLFLTNPAEAIKVMTDNITTMPYKKLPPIAEQQIMFNENNLRTAAKLFQISVLDLYNILKLKTVLENGGVGKCPFAHKAKEIITDEFAKRTNK